MNNAQISTGRSFNLGALRIEQIKVEPCFRLVGIMKHRPQTCRCSGCALRGDLGKVVQPK